MSDKQNSFREQLFETDKLTPHLKDTYRSELDTILYDKLTPTKRLAGMVFLVGLAFGAAAEIWAMFHYPGDASFYGAASTMAVVFAVAAAWVARDLWRGQSVRKLWYKIPDMLYFAGGILMLVQLIRGLQAPDKPASTFDVLFIFVFLFVCAAASLVQRIVACELALREEMLRIECRLADLAERVSAR